MTASSEPTAAATAESTTTTTAESGAAAAVDPTGAATATGTERERSIGTDGDLSIVDRALYALFARHADETRHATDRKRYRGTDLRMSFDVFLSRAYGASWLAYLGTFLPVALVVAALPPSTVRSVDGGLAASLPVETVGLDALPRLWLAAGVAGMVAAAAKHATVRIAGIYLRWLAAARRAAIERTLPGAVRYLNALSSGSDDPRGMLAKTAATDAYGATAVSLRKALNTARLTGSLDEGLRRVARDTPSRDLLAPFLLKFREHANQGEDALANYLRMEGRMLRYRQERARKRAEGYLELLAELFIVVLVLPALLVIVMTVMSVLAPGLSQPVTTPLGAVPTRVLVVYGSAAFVAVVGLAGAATVENLRPADQRLRYERPDGLVAVLSSTTHNPASAAVVLVVPAVGVGVVLALGDVAGVNVGLLSYVAFAVPVGAVAVRRARIDDAKDREIKDFVHAVAEHVSLGRPFPAAVDAVARDVDLGALNDDVADLAFNLSLTTAAEPASGGSTGETASEFAGSPPGETEVPDLRTAALDRFVGRVGTPLAEQSVGLVTGALNAGSDAEPVFETLQTEIGRLYHEKQALRSAMLVYVAVGWTTALLVIGIVVAVNTQVLDGFAQLSELSGATGFALDAGAVEPERERVRFYVVTQATMLASGWFAGAASRGPYEALLHSGLLVAVCYAVFAGGGML